MAMGRSQPLPVVRRSPGAGVPVRPERGGAQPGGRRGARAVGGYAPALNREKTAVYCIVNAYRPWSCDIEHIDGTLSKILQVTHLQLPKLRFVDNPNNGLFTTRKEYEAGSAKTREMLDPYCTMEFAAIYQPLHAGEEEPDDLPVLPLELHLRYPWLQGESSLR